GALRCGVEPGWLEDVAGGWGRELVPETCQLTADPRVAPGRVVAGHLQHEPADGGAGARPSRCPPRMGPVAPDQLGVPAQERAGVMIRDSWRRRAPEIRRVRAASNARSAQVSQGDLT